MIIWVLTEGYKLRKYTLYTIYDSDRAGEASTNEGPGRVLWWRHPCHHEEINK